MQRRDAIKRTALLLGYAMSASSIAAILNGCKADPKVAEMGLDAWTPKILSKENGQLIAQLAECIIPETEIPGAISAGVHSFIDEALASNYTSEDRQAFEAGLKDFTEQFKTAKGTSFLEASDADKIAFLTDYEKAAVEQAKVKDAPRSFWYMAKELTLGGYFTSEAGMKQALKFDPIPGEYLPCIPLDEVGGTWAI